MTAVQPSMKAWEAAWANAQAETLQRIYAADATTLPPGRAMIKGSSAIVAFFGEGLGTVEVKFFPDELQVTDAMAFEAGVVRDFQPGTETIVEECDYSIVWVRDEDDWKIKFHTWTVPK